MMSEDHNSRHIASFDVITKAFCVMIHGEEERCIRMTQDFPIPPVAIVAPTFAKIVENCFVHRATEKK